MDKEFRADAHTATTKRAAKQRQQHQQQQPLAASTMLSRFSHLIALLALVCSLCVAASLGVIASPTPEISSPALTSEQQSLGPKGTLSGMIKSAAPESPAAIGKLQQQQQQHSPANALRLARGPSNVNVDKLKHGLMSFVNQLNPASFFVPAPQNAGSKTPTALALTAAQAAAPSSLAEPSAIVNSESMADVVIKGPNRLTHTRPIGGPLRWG